MDNTEIRLRILFGCYAEMYSGQSRGAYLKGLAGVEEPAVAANTVYLIDKGLLKGKVSRYADGQQAASVERILAAGVDVVEEITRKSVSRLDEPAGKEISGSQEVQLAFWEKFVNVAAVCKVAVEVAGQVLAALG